MKSKYALIVLFFLVVSSQNCEAQKVLKLAQNGTVLQTDYLTKIPFRYVNNHIFIDVSVDGTVYNFLFDSGADFCLIDVNHLKNGSYKKIKVVKTSGSSFKTQKTQLIKFSQFSIADVDFAEIGAAIMDLSFINKEYHCLEKPIAGIIGSTLLRKSNWQIDYEDHEILFSDDISKLNVSKESFAIDFIEKSWGSPLVNVNINGTNKIFTLDTGSSGKITTGVEYLEKLDTSNYVAINREDKLKNSYTNYIVEIKQMNIGDITLGNHTISLEDGVSSLIGNVFFEHFNITLDWKNNKMHLDPIKELNARPYSDFEVTLKPNFATNKIQISGVYNTDAAKGKFTVGTEILKINETDVSNFSKSELCEFFENEWKEIRLNDSMTIATEKGVFDLSKSKLYKDIP